MLARAVISRAALVSLLAACAASPSAAPRSSPSPPPPIVRGPACGAASLLPSPSDLAARGPWAVGARTVQADDLRLEVWYPARAGSDRDAPKARYDLRTAMPPAEAAKIPDADNAWLSCECARDLPVDDAHGPYPVVVFLHGAASFRAQSAFLMTHWASRGFVVVAPDIPGIGLLAALGGEPQRPPLGVATQVLDLLAEAPPSTDPLAFVRSSLDRGRAIAGHSLGNLLATGVADRPEVAVRIAMAGLAAPDGTASWLALAGDHDSIAYAADAAETFRGQPARSRLGVVHGAGHLAFSDLCTLGADRGGALAIARAHGVGIPEILALLATDGCRPTDAPFASTAPVIRALTTGVLEETLRCDVSATHAIAQLASPALTLVENLDPHP